MIIACKSGRSSGTVIMDTFFEGMVEKERVDSNTLFQEQEQQLHKQLEPYEDRKWRRRK